MDYLLKIKSAKYLGEYKIYCLFSNGEEKIVDLKDELYGEMFEPLKDKNIFMQFRVDEILKTIIWPNGADIAPYSLYEIGKPAAKTISKRTKRSKVK
ncbi:MAG: DUF2442 domain-containing protein [Bacteroidetes bacterium]|nr:DUF2442 domain-containing protein [Bacteroidota bacterium]